MKNLRRNKIYIFEYEDAAYTSQNFLNKNASIPKKNKTVGLLRRVTNSTIDIALTWMPRKGIKYQFGIVIPRKALKSFKLLSPDEA